MLARSRSGDTDRFEIRVTEPALPSDESRLLLEPNQYEYIFSFVCFLYINKWLTLFCVQRWSRAGESGRNGGDGSHGLRQRKQQQTAGQHHLLHGAIGWWSGQLTDGHQRLVSDGQPDGRGPPPQIAATGRQNTQRDFHNCGQGAWQIAGNSRARHRPLPRPAQYNN